MNDRILRLVGRFLKRFPKFAMPLYTLYRLTLGRFTIGAVGVLFDADGRVLLVEHRFHRDFPWGLPGGWIERGEVPQTGVERELYEELNLTVQAILPVMVWRSAIWKNHIDMAFLMNLQAPNAPYAIRLSVELASYGWFALDDLPRLEANHRRVILQARAMQQQQAALAQQGEQHP